MLEITEWLDRHARRARRRPTLEAALLSRNLWPYLCYRLQYFGLRLTARLAVHVVTFLFIYRVFSRSAFVATVAAQAVAAFSANFWWGALETLRGRIRALRRDGQPHLIEFEAARWLSLAERLAAAVVALAVAWRVWRAVDERWPGPAEIYQTVIFFRLALQLVTLTLHSGVFAIRRIYRPPWAIVAVELAGFATALAFWPIAGTWGLPIASLLSALVSNALLTKYTLQTYRLLGIRPRSLLHATVRGLLPAGVPWCESGIAGLANAAIKIDTLLVFAAVGLDGLGERRPLVVALVYLLGPVVRATQDWAQLFYFDLKRLELELLARIRARYDRLVWALAWWVGASLWAVGGLLAVFAFQAPAPAAYLFLFPVFLVRSVLSIAQIRAFATGRYGLALATAAAWIAATMLLLGDGNERLKGALAFGGGVLACTLPPRGRDRTLRAGGEASVFPVVGWLAELGAAEEPTRIRAVQLAPRADSMRDDPRQAVTTWWATTRIARRIAKRLSDAGAAAVIWPHRVVWHECGARGRISREWLVRAAGGRLIDVVDTGILPDGPRALQKARAAGLFGSTGRAGSAGIDSDGVGEDLTRRFRRLCPRGAIYTTDAPPPPWLDALPNSDKRRILSDAFAFARDFRPASRRSFYDVTVLAADGSVRIIFVQDARTDRRRRARWRSLVRDANVAVVSAAFGPGKDPVTLPEKSAATRRPR
jgi:hypothetical protein